MIQMTEGFNSPLIPQSVRRYRTARRLGSAVVEPYSMCQAQVRGCNYINKTGAQKISLKLKFDLLSVSYYIKKLTEKDYYLLIQLYKCRIVLLLRDKLIFQNTPPIFNNSYIPQWGCHFKDQGCLHYSENKQQTRRKTRHYSLHSCLIQGKIKQHLIKNS